MSLDFLDDFGRDKEDNKLAIAEAVSPGSVLGGGGALTGDVCLERKSLTVSSQESW